MPISRKQRDIYIDRDVDRIIKNSIENQESKVVFVHGQGGVGKSTLLKNFLNHEAEEIPTVLISMQENTSTNFVDILLDEDITTIKHCPKFEQIKELLLDEPKLLNFIINSDTDFLASKMKKYDEEWGRYAEIFFDILKIGAKLKKSNEEKKKKEFLNNPEFVLLSALAEDLEDYGLFMVDTFEKIKTNNIKSKVQFKDTGEIAMSLKEKNYRIKDYVEGLIYFLVENATFVIAGRNTTNELNMEIPEEYTEEHSLERFSTAQIKDFFEKYAQKHPEYGVPTPDQLRQIEELTHGNPLLVAFFPKVLSEYGSWEEFDYDEMRRRVETDEKYGLLHYFTQRVLSHIDPEIEGVLWKLVIPRVLTYEIELELFGDHQILNILVDVGLAKRGEGRKNNHYTLLDNVYDATKSHAKREKTGGLASWHDNDEVKELHQKLKSFFETHKNIHGVNSDFEACYHNIMLKEGFEKDFQIEREEFSSFILGSLGLSSGEKHSICQDWKSIENSEVIKYIQDLKNEKDRANISGELYDELSKALAHGIIDNLEDINYLIKLSKDKFKKDWSIFFKLGIAYRKKGEYDNAIKAYQKAVEINPKNDGAYYNMGIAYDEKGEYDNAIEAYQKAVEINPKNDGAYYNMGFAYDEKGEYDNAIEAYQKAVEINPKKDEAYYNMGIAYYWLGEFDEGRIRIPNEYPEPQF